MLKSARYSISVGLVFARRRAEPWTIQYGKDGLTLTQFAASLRTPLSRARTTPRAAARAARLFLLWCISCNLLLSAFFAQSALAQIEPPIADQRATIHVTAEEANQWTQGAYEVWHLRGGVEIQQANALAKAREAVLWIDRAEQQSGLPDKVIAYLEEDVSVEYQHGKSPHAVTRRAAQTVVDKTWFGRFYTTAGIEMHLPAVGGEPEVKPALFQRGLNAREPGRSGGVQPAQFTAGGFTPLPSGGQPALPVVPGHPGAAATNTAPGSRRVTIVPRGGGRYDIATQQGDIPNEQIITVDKGVRVVVEGAGQLGKVDIETDRIVIWTSGLEGSQGTGQSVQSEDRPLEFYLEGNIVFRQGDRVIYADRMYYNVPAKNGVILGAEALTPVADYQGIIRLKADVLQQIDEQNFMAYNAAFTSSRMGVPTYWVQSDNISFQDMQRALADPATGDVVIDTVTGEPALEHDMLATSRNNFGYLGGYPVLYWPVLASTLNRPTFYLDRLTYRSDRVFGQQLLADWDLYELLGIRRAPRGTKLTLSSDYLSERGWGVGLNFRYGRQDFFGYSTPVRGFIDAWGIQDTGLDNLGRNRRAVPLDQALRGRLLAQHRQILPHGLQLSAEVGYISDHNFLEQYYEREWDQLKDQTTGIELKQFLDNTSWGIASDVRLNDFFTQTEWLPRLDVQTFGQSLFDGRLLWHQHSQVGYGKFKVASPPANAVEAPLYNLLAWETDATGAAANREGLRAGTRQELDLPFNVGPVKIVPYVLGDATYWGEDLAGNDLTRVYGQAGLRTSLPLWAANPDIQSTLFNLNGLAHKVTLESEFLYADANKNINQLPLYDQLDDDSQEHFRRFFLAETFIGAPSIPLKYDERFYALRTGMQSNVMAASNEIADDLMSFRMGLRQRLQTKRGLPGQERTIDWMVLDIQGTYFPKAARDNFNADVGLLNYDYRWHVGDRFTILSDGFADVFSGGLRTVSVGGILTRPEYGNIYVGYRSIDGPVTSSVLSAALTYRMTEKWIATGGASFDFGPTGNIGQQVSFTRVGEAMLVRLGFNVDASRGNFGAVFAIEPRFLPGSRLGMVGGVPIPPAGAMGLE